MVACQNDTSVFAPGSKRTLMKLKGTMNLLHLGADAVSQFPLEENAADTDTDRDKETVGQLRAKGFSWMFFKT